MPPKFYNPACADCIFEYFRCSKVIPQIGIMEYWKNGGVGPKKENIAFR
jgi:hypothetical protein